MTPLKATVGSEAQQYRPANAVNPPVPTKPPTYVSHFVKTETSQVSPYAPSDKKVVA